MTATIETSKNPDGSVTIIIKRATAFKSFTVEADQAEEVVANYARVLKSMHYRAIIKD